MAKQVNCERRQGKNKEFVGSKKMQKEQQAVNIPLYHKLSQTPSRSAPAIHLGESLFTIERLSKTFMANGKTETLLSCVYSRGKLFVFAMNSRRRYSIFVRFLYGLEKKNSKTEVIFAVCRLPFTSSLTSLIFASFA